MAINLQDLDLDAEFPGLTSLFRESRTRWLKEEELEFIYQETKLHPLRIPISEVKPGVLTTGLYLFDVPAYKDRNKWDKINDLRNTQSTNIYADSDYHVTVARKTFETKQFVRRTQRCSNKYKMLAIIHYRWEELNEENKKEKLEDISHDTSDEENKNEKVEDISHDTSDEENQKSKRVSTEKPQKRDLGIQVAPKKQWIVAGFFPNVLTSSSDSADSEEEQKTKKTSKQQGIVSADFFQKKKTVTKKSQKDVETSSSDTADSEAKEKKQEGERKTLFVNNLSYQVKRDDVGIFFKEVGEIVDIRLPLHKDGSSIRGFAFVEFASAQAAQKALKLNGKPLLHRIVWLELAHETGAFGRGGVR